MLKVWSNTFDSKNGAEFGTMNAELVKVIEAIGLGSDNHFFPLNGETNTL